LPQHVESKYECSFSRISPDEEEAAAAERSVKGRKCAEDQRRCFEGVLIYVGMEDNVNSHKACCGAWHAIVPGW